MSSATSKDSPLIVSSFFLSGLVSGTNDKTSITDINVVRASPKNNSIKKFSYKKPAKSVPKEKPMFIEI